MTSNIRIVIIGSLTVIGVLLLSACGIASSPASSQPTPVPGFGFDPGGMVGGGHMGGMMGGGMGNTMGGGHMGVPNGMMSGNGYNQSVPTVEPTPIGATPVPVDEEIQITAANLRFVPVQITVKPGETVRFLVTNNDSYLHNFVGPEAGIPLLNLPSNTTQTMTWTAPTTEGTYTALCTLHPGMGLTIVIKD